MKTFKRHCSVKEVQERAAILGWRVNTRLHDEHGSDGITVEFQHGGTSGTACFNTFNGRFFGETTGGEWFSSDITKHDGCEWFKELLTLFYVSRALS